MSEKGESDITSLKLRLDPRRRGYFLGDDLHSGFADEPALPREQRLLIARWAQHFTPDEVSDVQADLLASAGPPTVSEKQRHLLQNQRELRTPYLTALFDSLDPDDQRLVQDPGLAGSKIPPYPLSVGQMSQLTGASERQIRKWADDGVLPSYREGSSRRFYSAAAIRALALVRASNPSKALASKAARGEVGHHFQLLAATLGHVANQMPADLRERLNVLAEDLSSSSRLMADIGDSERLREIWQAAAPASPAPADPKKKAPAKGKVYKYRKSGKTRVIHHGKKIDVNLSEMKIKVEPRVITATGMDLSEADRILSSKYGGKSEEGVTLIFTTPRKKGEWVNQIAGQERAVSVHSTKAKALARGRELARERHGKHVVYSREGVIADTRDYG